MEHCGPGEQIGMASWATGLLTGILLRCKSESARTGKLFLRGTHTILRCVKTIHYGRGESTILARLATETQTLNSYPLRLASGTIGLRSPEACLTRWPWRKMALYGLGVTTVLANWVSAPGNPAH